MQKENYVTRDPAIELWETHANAKIIHFYGDYIKGKVLDVGCNHGASGSYWALLSPDVTNVTGLEIQESLRHVFASIMRLNPSKKNFDFLVADFTQPNLSIPEDDSFDTVISFHTLEHIYPEDVPTFLQNIYNKLKKGGYFIISIPYKNAYSDECHVSFYDECTLNELCNRTGFFTIECVKDERWTEKDLLTAVFLKQ